MSLKFVSISFVIAIFSGSQPSPKKILKSQRDNFEAQGNPESILFPAS